VSQLLLYGYKDRASSSIELLVCYVTNPKIFQIKNLTWYQLYIKNGIKNLTWYQFIILLLLDLLDNCKGILDFLNL